MPRKKSLDKPSKKAHTDGMNTTKPRTQSATCPCGTSFTREIKRGRPQVWCGPCMAIPFAKRTNTPVAPAPGPRIPVFTTPEVEAPAEAVERIVNANDPLDTVREIIEAEMVRVNTEHKARFAALVAEGMSPIEAGCQAMKETHVATLAVYAPFRRKTGNTAVVEA